MEKKEPWKYRRYTIEEINAALNPDYPPMSDEEFMLYTRDNVPSQKAGHYYHELGRRANLPKVRDEQAQNSDLNSVREHLNSSKVDLNSAESDLNSAFADLNFSNSDESDLIDMRFGRLFVLAYKRGIGYLCRCDVCGKNEVVTAEAGKSYGARLKYLGKRACPNRPRKGVVTRAPDEEAEHLGKLFGRLLVTGYARGTGYTCLCTECGEEELVKPAAGRSYSMRLEREGSRACGSTS